jgi:hypothetical protein
MWRRWFCPFWGVLGALALALALMAWTVVGRADAKAGQIKAQVQTDAQRILNAAGFSWARLEVDDEVGRVVGEAPSMAAGAAAFTAAGALLMPMMGLPGVFARLEDGQSAALPGMAQAPPFREPAGTEASRPEVPAR